MPIAKAGGSNQKRCHDASSPERPDDGGLREHGRERMRAMPTEQALQRAAESAASRRTVEELTAEEASRARCEISMEKMITVSAYVGCPSNRTNF